MSKETPSLARKMCAVMSQADYLQKKGRNTAQGYNYAQEADYLDLVKPLLVKHGVIFVPEFTVEQIVEGETKSGSKTCRMTLKLAGTFIDVDTGERLTAQTFGQGIDSQDKAPYKAMTGATKYLLAKTFLIPTGDDPEVDSDTDEKGKEEKPAPKAASPAAREAVEEQRAIRNQQYTLAVWTELERLGAAKAAPVLEKYGVSKKEEPEFTAAILLFDSARRKAFWQELKAIA